MEETDSIIPEIIVKAYKDGDFCFLYFEHKRDLDAKIDDLSDAGYTIVPCTKEEESKILLERANEETTPEMMKRLNELTKILR